MALLHRSGLSCVRSQRRREIRLERRCEFIERGCKMEPGPGLGTEFVMMLSQVLDEGLSVDDHCGSAVAFQPTHRAESRLQSAMVGFDPVVGVLVGVVKHRRCEFVDRARASVTTSAGSP